MLSAEYKPSGEATAKPNTCCSKNKRSSSEGEVSGIFLRWVLWDFILSHAPGAEAQRSKGKFENLLLRSGLALAEFNKRKQVTDNVLIN